MEKYVVTDRSIVYQTPFVIPAATHWYYELLNCHVRSRGIFQLLGKCTNIIFFKLPSFDTFIKRQRPNDMHTRFQPTYARVYPAITKLTAVDMSKTENLPFHLDKFAHYHNKTNCNIKYMLT